MSLIIHKETDWVSLRCDAYGGIPVDDGTGNREIIFPYPSKIAKAKAWVAENMSDGKI